jgi:hypothetical protein
MIPSRWDAFFPNETAQRQGLDPRRQVLCRLRMSAAAGRTLQNRHSALGQAAPCIPPVGVGILRGWYLEGMRKEPVSAEARWNGGLFGTPDGREPPCIESAPPDVTVHASEGELQHILPLS